MDKMKKEIAITAVLLPFCLILIWKNFISPGLRKEAAPAPPAGAVGGELVAAEGDGGKALTDENDVRLTKIREYASKPWDRNPFMMGETVKRAPLALEGILWDPASPLAMINGDVYAVGETVGLYEVTLIEKNRVSLKLGDETLVLELTEFQ